MTDEFFNLAGGGANGLLNTGLLQPGGIGGCAPACIGVQNDRNYFQAGVYVQHLHSGLWVLYNYGELQFDFAPGGQFNGAPDITTHYVKAGVRRRMHPLGHTIFYGEYLKNEDGQGVNTETEVWGLGVVQEIDAAAMSMWLAYRQAEFDDGTAINYNDLQWLRFGALINF